MLWLRLCMCPRERLASLGALWAWGRGGRVIIVSRFYMGDVVVYEAG